MLERRMELLAPAGDMDALKAAVQSGADAVYLGAGNFNARRNASNFEGAALEAAVAYCHARGVKVHVTLNTLVREDELEALEATICALNCSGADAVIVQDFGVARAVREIAPDLQLHASTQMAVHNAQGVRFLAGQGFDRVVLAREMDYKEMAACAGQGAEIEAFVHGALCVACSGQCLMSSLVGGRSGNRGLCAQPCRLPWRLDGHEGYLLSTRDLCGLESLARLRDAGVDSLKIEGRLKRAEYVAATVSAYRRALDALYAGGNHPAAKEDREALKQMFNRGGFTQGYGPGVEDVELMYAQRPNHLGVEVGMGCAPGEVLLRQNVETADVLVLRRQGAEDVPVRLAGPAGERVKCPAARKGDGLFRLVCESQMRAARACIDGDGRRIPVLARAVLRVGLKAHLSVSDGVHTAEAAGPVLEKATGRGVDADRIVSQLKKTGGTAYTIEKIELDLDVEAFCPASVLNALRREALAALESMRTAVKRKNYPMTLPDVTDRRADKPVLMAQSASPDVLRKALECGADLAVFAPEDVRANALDRILEALPKRFALALPAVLPEESLNLLNAWANRHAERIQATFLSNIGHFELNWPGARVGDYMLNIGNRLSTAQLLDWGMEGFTPSVELNAAQIACLGGSTNLIMWGRIPLMHLRHCPLRAAENMRGKHKDCRRCDGAQAGLAGRALIDRKGMAFPLVRMATPEGCVIQVLNSACLMPLRKLNRMPETGGWRLLLREDEPVKAVTRIYRAALDGREFRDMPEWRQIENMNTTTGHYFRGVE